MTLRNSVLSAARNLAACSETLDRPDPWHLETALDRGADANVELTASDRNKIEQALLTITVQCDPYPAHLPARVDG